MIERSIFDAALDIADPTDRAAFLEQVCAGNPILRQHVADLLDAQDGLGSFLARSPLVRQGTPTLDAVAEGPGTVVGSYKLLEKIGEGGMGVVYLAEQTEPVRRKVALKVIKPGMDSAHVIARFEAERQALALMDHPNIAKVLEAGTIDAGRPYFVMELVHGIPITDYCDQARLGVPARLRLFIDVCRAVQHAHTKGIIHRDLKPTNVLVTSHDGVPVAKVIDFGVAKALGPALTERTLHTGFAQMIGTPLYMSPEQAEFNQLGVDTRSDVYALGVLLYELLTGVTPFDAETLKTAALDELRRIIREDEPPRPSHRLSTLAAEAQSTVSQRRGVDGRRLGQTLRGELDWIVMRALEKDRTRRYESASAFAADVQRYLGGDPVEACPPSMRYRLTKFARRYKGPVLATSVVGLALILGVAGTSLGMFHAWQKEQEANEQRDVAQRIEREANEQRGVAQEQRDDAQHQRVIAQQQRDDAQRQRDEVRALAEQLRRTLYAARMNLAKNAWDAGGTERVLDLLDQHRPKAGEADLRSFEWHFLHRLYHSNQFTLQGHMDVVLSVAFSSDGKRLAGGSQDGTVKVWDTHTRRELATLPKQTSPVRSLAFSPDGQRLAGDTGTQVKVWDIRTGQESLGFSRSSGGLLDILRGDPRPSFGTLAFSPDGKRLASMIGSQVTVWNAETGQPEYTRSVRRTVEVPIAGNGAYVAFSPDGKHLAGTTAMNTAGSEVRVWDAQTGEVVHTLAQGEAVGGRLAFSPDGQRLAVASYDWKARTYMEQRTIQVWDVRTGQLLRRLRGRTGPVRGAYGIAFSSDGQRLVSYTVDGTIRVWDTQTGEEVLALRARSHIENHNGVALSPDGKHLAIASEREVKVRTVNVWDSPTDAGSTTLRGHTNVIREVAFSPNGRLLASASHDRTINLWDVRTAQLTRTLSGHFGDLYCVAFSPDGQHLASGSQDTTVRVWDIQTGQVRFRPLNHRESVNGVAFSSDGKHLASASFDGEVKVWDAMTGQEIRSLTLATSPRDVCRVAFSPDGKRLAGVSGKGVMKVWDTQTGEVLLTRDVNPTSPNTDVGLAFSPDGRRLATTAWSHTVVRVWDVQTGNQFQPLKGHTDWVRAITFNPDGRRLASCSGDTTAKVWDTETGQEVLSLKHVGEVNSIAFSPDGHRLACGTTEGTVKIWDATPLPP